MELEVALMAKVNVTGLDSFTTQLTKLAGEAEKINRGALGEGAGYVADQIKIALEGMPTYDDWYGTEQYPLYGATESEKEQIISNFGISRFKNANGKIETSVGFHGYVDTPSTKFNDRVPTGMLMQCINYGTRFRQGTHTVDNAIKAVKDATAQKMQDYIDQEVNKIIK